MTGIRGEHLEGGSCVAISAPNSMLLRQSPRLMIFPDCNGIDVLTFFQAQARARDLAAAKGVPSA